MKLLIIGLYDLIKFFKSKTAVAILFGLPIIFTIIVGLIFNNASSSQSNNIPKIPVGVVNLDTGEYGKKLVNEASKNETIKLYFYEENEIKEKAEKLSIEVGFIIPKDFSKKILESKNPEIISIKTPKAIDARAIESIFGDYYTNILMTDNLKYYMDSIVLKNNDISVKIKENIINEVEEKYKNNMNTKLITVKSNWFEGKSKSNDYDGKSQTSIGYIIMFVMFTVVLGAGEILEEKKNNTWNRLKTTPTGITEIYLGKVFGILLRGMTQIIVLITFGYFVIGISWGNSIFATITLLFAFLICVTGLGILVATIVKSNAQLGAISTIVIVPSTALSGCWWPLFIEPLFMQKLAVIFPQYWALTGLTNTVVGNLGFESIIKNVAVLLGMATLFFILALTYDRLSNLNIKKLMV